MNSFYFDNLQHALLRYPYLAFRVSHSLPYGRPPHFESDHGFVAGLHGPVRSQFLLAVMVRYADERATSERVRATNSRFPAGRWSSASLTPWPVRTKLPMTNSYNAHAFYMEELADWFSHVVFVNLRRDPIDNAVSIYRARQQLRQQMTDWWSIQPAACRRDPRPERI